eukprot:CAMPEP_0172798704 /NCGR_PEP_ID=MMETSP1075-20121228/1330_1 /TAXON_ID=2916 /ORGANISM="Ceratium fusus, Strain PA161109" /LENGTH=113 /DNA_ID=CAMNT_0013636223 /DNA_START=267 /DNA_END=604 /DNA_ORIENTATION=+
MDSNASRGARKGLDPALVLVPTPVAVLAVAGRAKLQLAMANVCAAHLCCCEAAVVLAAATTAKQRQWGPAAAAWLQLQQLHDRLGACLSPQAWHMQLASILQLFSHASAKTVA